MGTDALCASWLIFCICVCSLGVDLEILPADNHPTVIRGSGPLKLETKNQAHGERSHSRIRTALPEAVAPLWLG